MELETSSLERRMGELLVTESPEDLTNISLNGLEIMETLGTGTFATVKLVKSKASGRHYALKIMPKDKIRKLRQVNHIRSERNMLLAVDHPRIVKLYRTFQDQDNLYMLMEFCPGGELFFHLRRRRQFSVEIVKFYAAQIVLAFDYLHQKNFVYRDLKPENLLFDYYGNLKVADFGFVKELTGDKMTFTLCGTPEYIAPEIILNTGHSFDVDWWALGILIYEMLLGQPPFYDENQFRIYEKIVHGNIYFPRSFDPLARDLVEGLLQRDRTKRFGTILGGAQTIKNHPFFEGVNWDAMLRGTTNPPIRPRLSSPADPSIYLNARYEEDDLDQQPEEELAYDNDPHAFDEF